MSDPVCPVCSSPDVRLIWTTEVSRKVVGSKSGDEKPIFIVDPDPIEETVKEWVTCVNGHAHPGRVGFDVEWA